MKKKEHHYLRDAIIIGGVIYLGSYLWFAYALNGITPLDVVKDLLHLNKTDDGSVPVNNPNVNAVTRNANSPNLNQTQNFVNN